MFLPWKRGFPLEETIKNRKEIPPFSALGYLEQELILQQCQTKLIHLFALKIKNVYEYNYNLIEPETKKQKTKSCYCFSFFAKDSPLCSLPAVTTYSAPT